MRLSRIFSLALAAASLAAMTGCPKKLPGGVPGGPNVPNVPGGRRR
jgi:hypothetical protein